MEGSFSIIPTTDFIIRLVSIVHRFEYSFLSSEEFSLEFSSQDVSVVLHPELFNLLELVCVRVSACVFHLPPRVLKKPLTVASHVTPSYDAFFLLLLL